MADGIEDKVRIKPLNGGNWQNWKFIVERLLKSKDLWKAVTEGRPVDGNEADLERYSEKNRKAFDELSLRIEEEFFYIVRPFSEQDDGFGAWQALCKHFERMLRP